MDNMQAIFIISIIGVIEALHCDKEFNYYDNYGHGFDITCQGITEQHLHILSNITINNEISLTIGNSTLTNVTSDLFTNVRHLKCFYLENSTFVFRKDRQIFHLLRDLEHLVIKNTPLLINRNTLTGLESVTDITLSNNNISKIEETSFKSLISLRHLRITNNLVKDIDDLPLCEVRELRLLNLSSNIIEVLNDQEFYCRSSSQEMDLNLNDQSFAVHVKSNDFANIRDFSLELSHLDLSNNRIKQIGLALSDLKFLRTLRLDNNLLKYINNADLESLYNLEGLYVSNNYLETVGEKIFQNKENLEHMDFSSNKLKSIPLIPLPILEYLNLGYNKIKSLKFLTTAPLKTLQTLILCNNNIEIIEPYNFQHTPSLETLDLGNNKVILKNGSFSGLHALKKLILKNNSLETLPVDVFNELKDLRSLDLSQNKLKAFKLSSLFQNLINLEILNMSFNLIEDVNYDLLQPLDNLHVLDISGNKLTYIQYDLILSNLPLLSVLNIKSNRLSCEFLYKIIKFLKDKNVTYTTVERFDYEKENVAGIYCNNEEINSLNSELPNRNRVLINLGISVLTIIAVILVSIAIFKFHIYLKRRKYRADEFELIIE